MVSNSPQVDNLLDIFSEIDVHELIEEIRINHPEIYNELRKAINGNMPEMAKS